MSAATVQRRVREGSWERLHPAVYLVGGHRLTAEARVRAAWLWAGEDAAVSGPAAAFWHGLLDRAPDEIEVTVPRRSGARFTWHDLDGRPREVVDDIWAAVKPA